MPIKINFYIYFKKKETASRIQKLKLGVKCSNKTEVYKLESEWKSSPNSHLTGVNNTLV